MTDISKSPDRHTFQKNSHIKRCLESGKEVSQDFIDMFEKMIDNEDHKFDDPENRRNNMEYDLLTTDWILEKVRASESYSQNLYAAMCNNEFQKRDLWPILKEERWSCSWRSAGGIVANMRQEGDYINWYCSSIAGGDDPNIYELCADLKRRSYVPECTVTDEIREDLFKLGWLVK